MSIAHHHNEWLALLDISGPFLSLPVLARVFPQGLDAPDPALARELRLAYDEWRDDAEGLTPDPALHRVWAEWVLRRVLELPEEVLRAAPASGADEGWPCARIAEYGEAVRPELMVVDPEAGGKPRLLVVIAPHGQSLDKAPPRAIWQASWATRTMTLLRETGVRLGLLTNGEQWMLVDRPADQNTTTGFSSWYTRLWLEEPLTLRAFRTLLGAQRFFGVPEQQTIEALLAESVTNQQDVTDQLGYQVRRAVELLIQAFDQADQHSGRRLLAEVSEASLYESTLAVMMRLVFLLFAEEQHLLLLGDDVYDRHYAVSTLLDALRDAADKSGEEVLERRHDAWARLLALFRAVYSGFAHDRLTMPAYGGALFDPDRSPFLEGRPAQTTWRETPASPPLISNRVVLHLLEALQLLQVKIRDGSPAEARRISFRALDIEQIGHVYEGLLDHTAVRATEPVLGLVGTRDQEPELPLGMLEGEADKGETSLIAFLKERTGRSPSALKKAYAAPPDAFRAAQLRAACGNDAALYARVLPFAELIRNDDYGRPMVIPAGSFYVTGGTERRASGTHYTPRSLTEPIVQHTLEPLVYHGPAEGARREEWELRSAAELLRLRVCDMTMGSGAFLVQACRYLSERLLEAWARAEQAGGAPRLIDREGQPTDDPDQALPANATDRRIFAQRLVADRCLYGVDKNHLAVEMAKLSLWLITLAKGQAFSFLDHTLRWGDSLIGIAEVDQLLNWSLAPGRGAPTQIPLMRRQVERALAAALHERYKIAALSVREARDAQLKAGWLATAEAATALVRLGADLLVAAALHPEPKRREALRRGWELRFSLLLGAAEDSRAGAFQGGGETDAANQAAFAELRREADAVLQGRRPLHWPLEFPEVFEAQQPTNGSGPGFAVFFGNPPFQGGQRITGALGVPYRDFLVDYLADGQRGSADLCAYFFLRAGGLLRRQGQFGMLATNTIAQGDTREVGLDQLVQHGFSIPRAVPSQPWPGQAAVEVAVVYLRHDTWESDFILDGKHVSAISSLLTVPGATQGKPYRLKSNEDKTFIGSCVLGMGFILDPQEASSLIEKDARNQEVLFPYLNGEDLNSSPDQSPSRWVINFRDWPIERAQTYTEPFRIVLEKVKTEREKQNDKWGKLFWWRFLRTRPKLYTYISNIKTVLVATIVTQYFAPVFCTSKLIYAHRCCIYPFSTWKHYTTIQSNIHEIWARTYSSSLETRLNYSPSDCFETFPFPAFFQNGNAEKLEIRTNIDNIGERYHEHRRQLMLARQEGLTKTYNRFHTPSEPGADIAELRRLHVEMDNAVAAAYGWADLDLGHGFHQTKQGLRYTISEGARRSVLDRLLALNHERYAQEVAAGLHDKGAKRTPRQKRGQAEQVHAPQLDLDLDTQTT